MHTIESRSREIEILSFLVFLAGVVAAAVTLAEIIRTHVPLFLATMSKSFSAPLT
ncbi:hypothetical protein PQR02_35060 [Paraburkholderia sediminicola]|uniref:Uncharacterized protein n=1 Tax=Paraburkholderia rhynchosiae TaxID=487049 RepID=A0ACC7NLK7_9BURK